MSINMSEAVVLFLLGLLPTFLIATINTWTTFKSTNKNKEANISLIVGMIVTLCYATFLLYLFGSLSSPIKAIQNILMTQVNVAILLGWSFLLVIAPKTAKWISEKITRRGSTITINKNVPKKIVAAKSATTAKKSLFKDPLNKDLQKWHVVSGQPHISNIRGYSSYGQSLLLEENPLDSRNSFIIANGVNIKNGKITCYAYLERDAVLNIVFRANNSASDFYMARIDSRPPGSSGLLLAHSSRNWGYIQQPNSYVLHDRWYRIELNFNNSKIELKIDNDIITTMDKKLMSEGSIGLFNEVKRVFVNEFEIVSA